MLGFTVVTDLTRNLTLGMQQPLAKTPTEVKGTALKLHMAWNFNAKSSWDLKKKTGIQEVEVLPPVHLQIAF